MFKVRYKDMIRVRVSEDEMNEISEEDKSQISELQRISGEKIKLVSNIPFVRFVQASAESYRKAAQEIIDGIDEIKEDSHALLLYSDEACAFSQSKDESGVEHNEIHVFAVLSIAPMSIVVKNGMRPIATNLL